MRILITFCFFCIVNNIMAQKITGKVIDAENHPAEFANVLLLQKADSSLVKGALVAENGTFEIEGELPKGPYFVKVTLMGDATFFTPLFDIADKNIDLGTIQLKKMNIELNEVSIIAKKPLIEIKSDKLVMNVEGNLNSTGYNALELLRKAPGVMIDKDDNISLKAKNGTIVYIDGRPSNVQGKDLAAFLKSLQATDIEAIELISNPSAKYDAAGNAGIINIRLKKNRKIGTNGNVGATLKFGKTPKYDANFGLNYRNQKWNLYSNYSIYQGNYEKSLNIYRIQDNRIFDQKGINNSNEIGHNLKAGAEYTIDSKNSIGFIVNGGLNDEAWSSNSRMSISNVKNNIVDSFLIASNTVPNKRLNLNYNTNYRYVDTFGHELNIDLNYGTYNFKSSSFQPNKYVATNELDVLNEYVYKNNAPINIHLMNGKIDWEQNLWKGKLSTGVKISKVSTENVFDFWDVINNQDFLNINRSNKFSYDEQVNAAYFSYNRKISEKLSFQTGLRMENTLSKGALIQENPQPEDIVERNYTDLFPSASLTYNINKTNTLGLNYSRRIDRPNYQDLNPFENKLDELTYQKGNPFLKPQYSNNIELTHTFMSFLNTSLSYSKTTDLFSQIFDTVGRSKTYITNYNLNSQQNWSLNINAPLPIAKWWEGFINVWINKQINNATLYKGFDINASIISYGFYSEHSFKLRKDLSMQVSGWWNSPTIWGGTWKSKPMGTIDIGVEKKVLNGDGTIKLTLTDVFFTNRWNSASVNPERFVLNGSGSHESRQLRLNFTYRFGNMEVKEQRARKTGMEEDNNRIKSGK